MYIQSDTPEREHQAPPDYSGHTYKSTEWVPPAPQAIEVAEEEEVVSEPPASAQESVPAGAFGGGVSKDCDKKGGKRGDLFGNLGLGGLFSRVPLLSSLAPPPRTCGEGGRRHGELWDWLLLAVIALSLLGGKDDDVLPILLLLLLWD